MSYLTDDPLFTLPVPKPLFGFSGQGTRVPVPIGSWVAGITQALGVKPCAPCEQRKQYLDSLLAVRPWGER